MEEQTESKIKRKQTTNGIQIKNTNKNIQKQDMKSYHQENYRIEREKKSQTSSLMTFTDIAVVIPQTELKAKA